MDVKYEGLPDSEDRIVYVREVAVKDLPEEVQREAGGLEKIYAVHNAEGARLALGARPAHGLRAGPPATTSPR